MTEMSRKYTQVKIDWHAIDRLRDLQGIAIRSLEKDGVINHTTYNRSKKSGCMRNDVFEAVVKRLGGERDDFLLSPNRASRSGRAVFGLPPTEEWAVDESTVCSEWITLPNGLQYKICKMKHITIADHFGRGKYFDLMSIPLHLRDTVMHRLERHAIVAKSVIPTPHLTQVYSCVADGTRAGWWVIDRWIDGATLSARLAKGVWPRKQLSRLMKDILNGLSALHDQAIILRELNPRCICVPDSGPQAVITDFEMAKLYSGQPTVRNGHWPSSRYRAPEVDSDQLTPSTDLFSWAMVLLFAANGTEPDSTNIRGELENAKLPGVVAEVVTKCLSSAPSRRPKNCEAVRKAISKWT
ncbi:MAG: protein kinase [Planctomycetaceae bacterium]|nr:protein kinase [Planctomycetaceae bacterium]